MTLTVPKAGNTAGRAARIQHETPQVGAAVAQLGDHMLAGGTALENDRLSRELNRLSVDLTGEMNDLRLRTQEIGDPEQMGVYWDTHSSLLRQKFMQGQSDQGRPLVDPKNHEKFGLMFDDLANKHGFSIGAKQQALRFSQRAATLLDFEHVATTVAANGDLQVNEQLVAEHAKQVDQGVAGGWLTPEKGAKQKIDFAGNVANSSAIGRIAQDPQAFLEEAEQGLYDGLGGEALARLKVQAQTKQDAQATATLKAAEQAEKDRTRAIGQQLAEIRAGLTANAARFVVDEQFWNSPAVKAHPDFAQSAALRDLMTDQPFLRQMAPAELTQLIQAEQKSGITRDWQNERLEVLEQLRADLQSGYAKDAIATAKTAGHKVPPLPQFDPQSPAGYAAALAQRVAFAQELHSGGYAPQLRILDDEERAQLRALAGPEADPQARVALAMALAGSVPNTVNLADIVDDRAFAWSTGLMASGGSPATAREVFRGQQVLEEKNVVLPSLAKRADPVFSHVGGLFAGLDGGEQLQASMVEAADAIYAARVRHQDPDAEIDTQLYRQALHEAAGGSGRYDDAHAPGGVQDVRGALTFLPPDVSAFQADRALDRVGLNWSGVGLTITGMKGALFNSEQMIAQFAAASGGRTPTVAGEPLGYRDLQGVHLMAVGNDAYKLIWSGAAGDMVVEDETGAEFVFSLRSLIREVAQ